MFDKTKALIIKIRNYLSLYGFKTMLFRSFKSCFRNLTTVTWEHCLILTKNTLPVELYTDDSKIVKELSFSDFNNKQWSDFLTEEKKILYLDRFNDVRYKAFGLFINDQLAYSAWILMGAIEIQGVFHYELAFNDVCLLDVYCHPKYRNKGIHIYMIKWLINNLNEASKGKCFVTVYSYNKPSLKAFLKLGFKVNYSFYLYKYGGKKKCTLRTL